MQQHYRRLARSAALIGACLLIQPGWAALCGEPGRDGSVARGAVINSYYSGAAGQVIEPGSHSLTLTRQQGSPPQPGDLALLLQVQGADISTANNPSYGELQQSLLAQEWVRISEVNGAQVRLRGAGPNGGVLHRYENAVATASQGRRRWQLVRVPQYEQLTLSQDLKAQPWDGYTGGVLALDVRRQLNLNGHTLSVAGSGFRGAPAVSLFGALGRPEDWRYATPSGADREAGYGHHGSKGEGLAGTPVLLLPAESGYPKGDMARGAPGNAGGGGNGLDLSHQRLGNGGGGGNGGSGESGLPADGGGEGGGVAPLFMSLGGGGGAAARRQGEGGAGGAGGGLLVIRAPLLEGKGILDLRGLPGSAAGKAGGGGGAAGTLWLDLPAAHSPALVLREQGGAGAQGGGDGGAARKLSAAEGRDGFQPLPVAGADAGFRCRPAGHWVSGWMFEDNGGGRAAFNGRLDQGESPLAGWSLALSDASGNVQQQTVTGPSGAFQFRLSDEESHGQPLWLSTALPQAKLLPAMPTLNGVAGERHGDQLRWPLRAVADQASGPLYLALVSLPRWQAPADQRLEPGTTTVLTFEYRSPVQGMVSFGSEHPAVRGLLMDRQCSGDSDRWQSKNSAAWPVSAGEKVCVRVPLRFPGQDTAVTVTATTRADRAPAGFAFPVHSATVKIHPTP